MNSYFKIGDRVQESNSKVTGTITEIDQGYDPYITMLGDNSGIYTYHSPHYTLLYSEDEFIKESRDRERDEIIKRQEQRKKQAIIIPKLYLYALCTK